ncbi:MAG: hypothetical protein ACR2M0_15870 [Chloroflexia bacterium]
MRRMNMTICAALLGAGVLLNGCGGAAATDTPGPTPTEAVLPATNVPPTDTIAAGPPTLAAPTDTAVPTAPPPAPTDTSAPPATQAPPPATDTASLPPPTVTPEQRPAPTHTRVPVPPTARPTVGEATAVPTIAAAGNQLITNANDGQTITMKVGETLLVELRDRKWSTPVVDTSILAVAPLNIMVPVGATAWKYKAIAPGRTSLTTEGSCLPSTNGGPRCLSIQLYKVTIIVTK